MDAFDAIMQRHGVLRYDPAPVQPEEIERVLRAAVAAPSPANTQPWAFLVVTEPELTRQVAEGLVRAQREDVFGRLLDVPEPFVERLMTLYDELTNAPCFIVLCRHRRVELAPAAHTDTVRDWELCSLGAAMANLMTAATALGLGTRWFGSVMMEESAAPLRRLLSIPDGVEIVAVTPLGYHEEPPKERPVQPLEALIGFRRGSKEKLAALLDGKLALEDVVYENGYGKSQGEA